MSKPLLESLKEETENLCQHAEQPLLCLEKRGHKEWEYNQFIKSLKYDLPTFSFFFPSSYLTLHYANHLPNEAKVMLRNSRLASIDLFFFSAHYKVLVSLMRRRLVVRLGGCHLIKMMMMMYRAQYFLMIPSISCNLFVMPDGCFFFVFFLTTMNETAGGTRNLKQSWKEPIYVLTPKKHVIGQQLTVIHYPLYYGYGNIYAAVNVVWSNKQSKTQRYQLTIRSKRKKSKEFSHSKTKLQQMFGTLA